jgi:DNA-binding GntR family transcriptional regulator
VLSPIQELLIESRRQTLGRHGAKLAHEHHARILAAVRAGDAERASLSMREHIEANFQHLHAAASTGKKAPPRKDSQAPASEEGA